MKFYLIIPVYNTSKYLRRCLDSIADQYNDMFNIILVDDKSTDDSLSICKEYSAKYNYITVLEKEHSGLLLTRCKGIEYVKTIGSNDDYIMFLDSDDFLKEDCFKSVISAVHEFENCDLIIAGYYNYNNEIITNEVREKDSYVVCNKKELYNKVFLNSSYNAVWRKIIKSSLFDTNLVEYKDFGHVFLGEDLLLSVDLYRKAKNVCFYNKVIFYYCANENSIVRNPVIKNYRLYSDPYVKMYNVISQEEFTENDFLLFKNHIKNIIRNELIFVGKSKANNSFKKEYYDKINNDTFFKMIIDEMYFSDRLINKLKRRKYIYIIQYSKCRAFLSKIKRMFINR